MAAEHESNVKFVLEVKKHACLYNYTLPEYVRKDLVDKAWINVGKKVNLTGPECKEKWRNIRSVFVRNLKPTKKKKPYYLNEVMQFTLPFIKLSNPLVSGTLPIPTDQLDDCIIDESNEEDIKLSFGRQNDCIIDESNEEDKTLSFGRQKSTGSQSQSLDSKSKMHPRRKPQDTRMKVKPMLSSSQFPQEWSSSSPLPTSPPQSMTDPLSSRSYSTPSSSKKKDRKSDFNIDDGILQYKAKQARKESLENLEQNPKKMFLLSLLPDVEPMSDGQMRVFKRRAVQVIEEIYNNRPSTSSMDYSELPVIYENITPNVNPETDDSIESSESDDSTSENKVDLS